MPLLMGEKEIITKDDFFEALGVKKQTVTYVLYIQEINNMYTSFNIPKKTGGDRVIHAPKKALKNIQIALYKILLDNQMRGLKNNKTKPLSNVSHAFEKNKSIITNAQNHRNKKIVLNIDLEDFFESFHFGRVKGFFEKNNNFKVPSEIATMIAQLSCYNGKLPQGAPSSPIITNLICNIMDYRIIKIAKKYKLSYTRYADDLTFSTNYLGFKSKYEEFLSLLTKEIQRAGFQINSKKTRIQYEISQQTVTGLVVNKKINVPRDYYKETRAMAHSLYNNNEFFIKKHPEDTKGTIEQLNGRFAFINQLDKFNNAYYKERSLSQNKIEYQKNLLGPNILPHKYEARSPLFNNREREYQKFLFYKYFYANKKTIIVTEGKTDSRYLKAALKKIHTDYPGLVTKDSPKYFKYNFMFLNRSKTLKYFFNLGIDGADQMKNLYNFFSDKNPNSYINYLKYFQDMKCNMTDKKVIFLFDNEQSKAKPLKNFINHISKTNSENTSIWEEIQNKFHIKINEKLYIVTIPSVDSNKDYEIENLFDEEFLKKPIIDGKSFSGKDGNISKEIFSNYVLENYQSINFDGFRKLLDILNDLN